MATSDVVAAAAPAAARLRDAAAALQALAAERRRAHDYQQLGEWDGSALPLPLDDDTGTALADDARSGDEVTPADAAVLAAAAASAAAELRGQFGTMQQAAVDVASALQEHASRIRHAPATAAGMRPPFGAPHVVKISPMRHQFTRSEDIDTSLDRKCIRVRPARTS